VQTIRNLEIHLVHSCNLSCESCSHYSNHGHKGVVSLEEADRWMKLWNRRVRPQIFSLLGGEPTIHPQLTEFVSMARTNWPDSSLRIVTNGFFLHRHPQLPAVLREDPDAAIFLSIHHEAPEYQAQLQPIFELLAGWRRDYGIRVELYPSFAQWTQRYRGFGSAMTPFDDRQPRQSWENCRAKYCPQLFDGKLYKCGPLAYLNLQHATYPLSTEWMPYLNYQPLDPGCTRDELAEFLQREEETCCAMCPANPKKFTLPIPLRR
jgi:hypothetical protein